MRSAISWLALAVLCVAPQALGAPSAPPPYVRTSLDEPSSAPVTPPGPRRIRSTLDDGSHVTFPTDAEGRLIRLSLGEGAPYGRLSSTHESARRIRITLD